jgi:3-oxoadipate enol-lactonase
LQKILVGPAPRLALSVAGEGPLLLFLHGLGGRRQNWDAQLAFFSKQFKAAAWDARGYGESDDYEGPLQFSVFSDDVLRLLDHFKVEKTFLVGLSMGGRIARNFALHHPERVAALVLANTTPGFGSLTPQQVREFVEQRRNADPIELAQRLVSPHARPGARDDLVASLRAVHRESYLKTLEASVAQDQAAAIERIRAPTLVVTSEDDRLYPPAIAQDMVRRIPGARLALIERAGHLSNMEQPDRFNQVVLEFLLQQEK